ncbi:hypothetical protein [Aureispira anguillae]|uniref:Uncharacterized protein n=1 Tax=Aureispira anguillae TaxID=2864201 RepID=A0A915YFJ1_9BACT|nr:hypothetical protein [Aureispira anguillae]BDS12193.1 hypothetical protein AsAng_0029080 [Aureispira anguillae]
MKKIFTLLIFCCLAAQITFAQSQKTFVKSLATQASTVVLNLDGATNITEWDEQFIRVTTTIELTNFNEEILKRLVAVGRYTLETTTKDGVMTVNMPKLATKVTIKGQLLNEVLNYEILVPKGITIETSSDYDSNTDTVN